MLSKLVLIGAFAMGHFLYYDLTGALLFAIMVLLIDWVIGK